jgi:ribonuclease P protein component
VRAAASDLHPESGRRAAVTLTLAFPRSARLRTTRDFQACRAPQFRASLRWVGLSARVAGDDGKLDAARVRIGLTVGKRVARKSVQRNLVKRVLREAARHALPQITQATALRRVDIVLHMKAAFPSAEQMPLAAFRRALRAETDLLMLRLIRHLASPAPVQP